MSQFVNSRGYIHTDPRVFHNPVSDTDPAISLLSTVFDPVRTESGLIDMSLAAGAGMFAGNIDNFGLDAPTDVKLPSVDSVQGKECQFTCIDSMPFTLTAPVPKSIAMHGRFYTHVTVPPLGGSANVYSDGVYWNIVISPSVTLGQ